MKIITWNCNMAFRRKAGAILALQPDILVVPECECPEKLAFGPDIPIPKKLIWYGSNPNKGLAVLSYSTYSLKLLPIHNASFKTILPLSVSNGREHFILFAIWANNPADKDGAYITQIWKAMHCYEGLLKKRKVILIGDFNSNTIWDRPRRIGNHTDLVKLLEQHKIKSTYHVFHKQSMGKEKHPTQFMYRHSDKPYHLDYCFVSSYFMKNLQNVEIGAYQDWTGLSDHKPLSVTFSSGE